MSADKNFSTADNNDPQPPAEKQGASANSPKNAHQEPKYTQLYGLGADSKMSMEPPTDSEPQSAEGKPESYQHTPKQFDIAPKPTRLFS